MMISPNMYGELHKDDSFEQLIAERKELIATLEQLEPIAYDKEHRSDEWKIMPAPDVRYQIALEYLSKVCKLIREKYNREIVWGE